MIHFNCVHCGELHRVVDDLAGRPIHCPICAGVIQVPSAEQTPPLPPVGISNSTASTLPRTELPRADSASRLSNSVDFPGIPSTVAGEVIPPRRGSTGPLPSVPGYEILGELGRGGMGVVYRARQLSLRREVALKMVLAGSHASPEELTRFRQEAEAVAALQHPNIVQIHEIGSHEDRPFFSLEFIGGGNLAQFAARQAMPAREAAELVALLARAVHHAHERGIVHRDLKPANILLGDASSTRVAKVTDFGLAKRVNESGQTQTGAVMGTPSYMAPEQAAGRTSLIGPLADVYALGAILYELLTRRPPFKGETLLETLEQVRNKEPIPPRQLQPRLHRDLDTICLMALAKEPGKRYATALALAEDLERFTAGESILARPVGMVEKAWRRVRRHPIAFAATPLILVLLAIAGYATWATRSARQLGAITRRIEARVDAPELSADFLSAVNADILRLQELAPDHAAELRRRLHRRFADQVRDSFAYHKRPVLPPEEAEQIRALIDHLAADEPEDVALVSTLRDDLARRLAGWQSVIEVGPSSPQSANDVFDATQVEVKDGLLELKATLPKNGAASTNIVLTHQPCNGDLEIEAEFDDSWDSASEVGLLLNASQGHAHSVTGLAFSRDGRLLASASGAAADKGQVRVWDVTHDREVARYYADAAGLLSVAFTQDGGRLLIGNTGQAEVLLINPRTGKVEGFFSANKSGVGAVAVSSDGKTWATAGADAKRRGDVILWDAETRRERLRLASGTGPLLRLALTNDGRYLAAASEDRGVVLWDVVEKKIIWAPIRIHIDSVPFVRFSPDSRTFIYPGYTRATNPGTLAHEIGLYDLATRQVQPLTTAYHSGGISALAVSPDGRGFAMGSSWGSCHLRLASLDGSRASDAQAALSQGDWFTAVEFSPDGRTIAAGAKNRSVRIWHPGTGAKREIAVDSNYTFRLSAGGVSRAPLGSALPRASLLSMLEANRKVQIQILRDDVKLRQQDLSISEITGTRLRLKARRLGNRLSFQVNQLPPVEFSDTFPLPHASGMFGVAWPAGVRLASLRASRKDLPDRPSPLEQGDRLFAARAYDQAGSFYAQQRQAAANAETAIEARLKEGLCHSATRRLNEAAECFEWVMIHSAQGHPWRIIAACHLWMTRIDQNRLTDADAVFEVIAKSQRARDVDLLGHVPIEFPERIMSNVRDAVFGANLIKPRTVIRGYLKRAVAVQEVFPPSPQERFQLQVLFMETFANLGETDDALRIAQDLLRADPSALPARTLAPVAVQASRLLRRKGKAEEALRELNRHLPAERGGERDARAFLLLERARIYCALEQWAQAEKDLDEFIAQGAQNQFEYNAPVNLLLGFVREQSGNSAAALEAWRQGSLRGWHRILRGDKTNRDYPLTGIPSRVMIDALICGSLADEIADAEAKDLLDSLLQKHGGESSLVSLRDISPPPTLLRDIWKTPRGRDCARHVALLDVSDIGCHYFVIRLTICEVMKRGALTAPLTDDQESLLWLMACGCHEHYLEGKIGTPQAISLGLTWKGTTNFLGWGGVKNSFEPALRGPLAYFFGHRFRKLNKPAEATAFFQQAFDDAPVDSKLRKLARAELERK